MTNTRTLWCRRRSAPVKPTTSGPRDVKQLISVEDARFAPRLGILYKQCSREEAWAAFAENIKVWFSIAPCNTIGGWVTTFSMDKNTFRNVMNFGDNHCFRDVIELAKNHLRCSELTYFVEIPMSRR